MKGIILAGGEGTRLRPLTNGISKQLLPVYKQPMIFYPLKTLIGMGISNILVIVSNDLQKELFQYYLKDGRDFNVEISYIIQKEPNGLAEAFIIGEDFIGEDDVTLILGDNVFLSNTKIKATPNTIFTYKVKNPSAYGVVKLNEYGRIDDIIEKPSSFISNDAVVGLYVFTNTAVSVAKYIKPSQRGELEIVDVIRELNHDEGVDIQSFNGVWFDCGTHDDLLECSEFVRALTKRTNHDILLLE
jgi:glucose-1-phosphate thymidylyltransferase